MIPGTVLHEVFEPTPFIRREPPSSPVVGSGSPGKRNALRERTMRLPDLPVDVLADLLSKVPLRNVYYLLLVSKSFHEAQIGRRRAMRDLFDSPAGRFVRDPESPDAYTLNFDFLESSTLFNVKDVQFNNALVALSAAILPITKGGIGVLGRLGRISFMNCQIGDTGFTAFASACASGSMGALKALALKSNEIGDEGMKAFATASGSLGALISLVLSHNRIGNAGITEFSRAIASGSLGNLAVLDLDKNQIGDEGMAAFAAASGSLRALHELALSSNQIGDAGMTEFCSAITSGSLAGLTNLLLDHNKIGDVGMAEFSRAIASGSLASLDILTVEVADYDYLQLNPHLRAACEARFICL